MLSAFSKFANKSFSIEPRNTLRDRVVAQQRAGKALSYADWKTILQVDGYLLTEMPKQFYNKEMFMIAVRSYGNILEAIPFDWVDEKNRPKDAPTDWITDETIVEICLLAVTKNGYALKFVPLRWLKQEMCDMAVINYGRALAFVPEDMQHEQMYINAIAGLASSLELVPYEKRSLKLCVFAFDKDITTFEHIPDQHKEEWMCLAAVKRWPKYYKEVPEERRTPEMRALVLSRLGKEPAFTPNKSLERKQFLDELKKHPPGSPEMIQALYKNPKIYTASDIEAKSARRAAL